MEPAIRTKTVKGVLRQICGLEGCSNIMFKDRLCKKHYTAKNEHCVNPAGDQQDVQHTAPPTILPTTPHTTQHTTPHTTIHPLQCVIKRESWVKEKLINCLKQYTESINQNAHRELILNNIPIMINIQYQSDDFKVVIHINEYQELQNVIEYCKVNKKYLLVMCDADYQIMEIIIARFYRLIKYLPCMCFMSKNYYLLFIGENTTNCMSCLTKNIINVDQDEYEAFPKLNYVSSEDNLKLFKPMI